MEEHGVWIGIDVAKEWLDVADSHGAEAWRVGNDADGIAALVAALAARAPRGIALEATGGLERAVFAALLAAGLPAVVVDPARVRAFATARGQRAKTDALDARVLAAFAERMQPPARPAPDPIAEELRGILARRRQLVEMHTMEENRRATVAPRLLPKLEAHLAWLRAQIAELDGELEQTIRANPAWRAKEELLCSIPGIGKVVARTLLAQMPELGTLTGREAAALAGVAPLNRDSGRTTRHRSIGGGRSGARAVLYMAAMTAARCEPTMRAFAARLGKQGKPGKVTLVACMRKLLTIANAVLRDGVPWRTRGAAMA